MPSAATRDNASLLRLLFSASPPRYFPMTTDPAHMPSVRTLSPHDPAYPGNLLDLRARRPDPLFARGVPAWPARPIAAVVGARAMTAYARSATRRVVAALVGAGAGVVSGLARGVDRAAHEAALARGGFTAAVVGTGVDRVYPREHADLYTAITEHGVVFSEFAPGTDVRRGHFPSRNRIIAALGDVLVLVQADAESGSRHTVAAALRLGRPVLVAPWPLAHAAYAGNAAWVARNLPGVRVLTAPEDAARAALAAYGARAGREDDGALPGGGPHERLAQVVGARPRGIAALARAAGLPVGEAAAALLALEIAGRIERAGGDRYRRRER